MRDGLRILDADAHVAEPASLFAPWTPPGRSVLDLPPTTPMVPCGDFALVKRQIDAGFSAESYLEAMDAQGIDAVVLYPSFGLFVPFLPELAPEEAAAACRAYNEWVAAYCDTEPTRMAAVGVVPQAHVDLAVEEAGRAASLGLVGVLVRPNRIAPVHLGEAAFDPLYELLAARGLVLAVHEGLGIRHPTIGSDRFTGFAARHACSHPLEQMTAMTALMLGGVLERHPSLRVAFLESGTGWLPYWLHRLDGHRDWLRDTECAELSLSPSDYFARQCAISSEADDELAAWVIGQVGGDHVMWASDFPHPDAVFPHAADEFLENVRAHGADAAEVAAVMWDTPLRFYGLERRFAG